MSQGVADQIGDDLFQRARVTVQLDVGRDVQLDAVGGVFELGSQGGEQLLDGLAQGKAAAAHAGLIDRHLLEVANQVGGAGGVALQQIDRFAAPVQESVRLRAAQRAGLDGGSERAHFLAQTTRDHAGIAQRSVEFVCHPGYQVPQGGQLFRLHQLGHRLAQFGGAFGNQFLQVFPVQLQLLFSSLALGDVADGGKDAVFAPESNGPEHHFDGKAASIVGPSRIPLEVQNLAPRDTQPMIVRRICQVVRPGEIGNGSSQRFFVL